MIVTRTPLRISFAGGGSDLPAFYKRHGGAVLSASINQWVRVAVLPRFDEQIRVSYSTTEMVDQVDQIKHELIRESLIRVGVRRGVDVATFSDVPAIGTGLGSSSAITVSALHALYSHIGVYRSPGELAREAVEIETRTLNKPIGSQDQYAAAFGGFNLIEFDKRGDVRVNPLVASDESLSAFHRSLMLFFTGSGRGGDEILSNQQRLVSNEETVEVTVKIREAAYQMRELLTEGDINGAGALIGRGWEWKREAAPGSSTDEIDRLYDEAREAGATGGKLLGAGGGGFFLIAAPTDRQQDVRKALSGYREIPFQYSNGGSAVMVIER